MKFSLDKRYVYGYNNKAEFRHLPRYGGVTQLVEYPVHTRYVTCSNQVAATRPVGQAVKTPPFHGGNMGSIPVRVTKKEDFHSEVLFFCYAPWESKNPIATVRWTVAADGLTEANLYFRQRRKCKRFPTGHTVFFPCHTKRCGIFYCCTGIEEGDPCAARGKIESWRAIFSPGEIPLACRHIP